MSATANNSIPVESFDINDEILSHANSGLDKEGITIENERKTEEPSPGEIHHADVVEQQEHETKRSMKDIFTKKNTFILTIVAASLVATPYYLYRTVESSKQALQVTIKPVDKAEPHTELATQQQQTTTTTKHVASEASIAPVIAASQTATYKTVPLPNGTTIRVAPLPPQAIQPQPASVAEVVSKGGDLLNKAGDTISQLKQTTEHTLQDATVLASIQSRLGKIDAQAVEIDALKTDIQRLNAKIDSLANDLRASRVKQAEMPSSQKEKPQAKPVPQPAKQNSQPVRQTNAEQHEQILTLGNEKAKTIQPAMPSTVETTSRSKFGIVGLTKDTVTLNVGGGSSVVHIGEQLPDGSTVLRVIPSSGIVVTDKVILKLSGN